MFGFSELFNNNYSDATCNIFVFLMCTKVIISEENTKRKTKNPNHTAAIGILTHLPSGIFPLPSSFFLLPSSLFLSILFKIFIR